MSNFLIHRNFYESSFVMKILGLISKGMKDALEIECWEIRKLFINTIYNIGLLL